MFTITDSFRARFARANAAPVKIERAPLAPVASVPSLDMGAPILLIETPKRQPIAPDRYDSRAVAMIDRYEYMYNEYIN